GWAAIPIRISDLMRVVLQGINNPNLPGSTVLLFDGDRPSQFHRLYDPANIFGTPSLTHPNYQQIKVPGRTWLVGVQLTRALPGPDGLHWTQAVILLVGALLSALAALFSRELLLSQQRTMDANHQLTLAAEEQAIASAVFEGMADGVVITNPDGLVQSLNQSFTQLTGYTNLDLRGRSLRILRSNKHADSLYQTLWNDLRSVGNWRHEIWNRCKDGRLRLHDVSITTVIDKDLQPQHFVAHYQDVTDRHREQQLILYRATHDALTGLSNRTQLEDRLEQTLALAQR
ncbi:MAG TPA: PAS domain S-box protein, partial [Candidatus Kapabacteria bacterium]|nr:PAS domain S-box protein [Candidatus Kapabacteria bacterium]